MNAMNRLSHFDDEAQAGWSTSVRSRPRIASPGRAAESEWPPRLCDCSAQRPREGRRPGGRPDCRNHCGEADRRLDSPLPSAAARGRDDRLPDLPDETTVHIEATAAVTAKTGVEMEALVAVSAAALTIYDMCKSVDREMVIESIRLEEKSGGQSGHFTRG